QVFFNRPTNLMPLERVVIDFTDGLSQADDFRTTGKGNVLIPLATVNFFDNVAFVDIAVAGQLVQIVAGADRPRHTANPPALQDIEFDAGGNRAFPIVHTEKLNVTLVMTGMDLGAENLNLFDQLALVRIDGVEPVYHVIPLKMCRRIS